MVPLENIMVSTKRHDDGGRPSSKSRPSAPTILGTTEIRSSSSRSASRRDRMRLELLNTMMSPPSV